MNAEHILNKHAQKNMKQWDIQQFKITHPRLYKSIIDAIEEGIKQS